MKIKLFLNRETSTVGEMMQAARYQNSECSQQKINGQVRTEQETRQYNTMVVRLFMFLYLCNLGWINLCEEYILDLEYLMSFLFKLHLLLRRQKIIIFLLDLFPQVFEFFFSA